MRVAYHLKFKAFEAFGWILSTLSSLPRWLHCSCLSSLKTCPASAYMPSNKQDIDGIEEAAMESAEDEEVIIEEVPKEAQAFQGSATALPPC